MKEEKQSFWEKWIQADEVERLKLVRTLPAFSRGGVCRYMTATLMNSYLIDLYKETRRERLRELEQTHPHPDKEADDVQRP